MLLAASEISLHVGYTPFLAFLKIVQRTNDSGHDIMWIHNSVWVMNGEVAANPGDESALSKSSPSNVKICGGVLGLYVGSFIIVFVVVVAGAGGGGELPCPITCSAYIA